MRRGEERGARVGRLIEVVFMVRVVVVVCLFVCLRDWMVDR